MLVKQEQVNPCEVELHIEIEAEKVSSAVESAYSDLAKVTNVPGFRKGKAPRVVLERYLDEEKVKDHAADKLVQPAYIEALEESKVEPFAPADVKLVTFELGQPMVFTAKVPLAPQVELGEYVGLEVERKVPPVEDSDVDERVKRLLEEHTEFAQITDRAVQEGDTVVVEIKNENEPDEEPKRNVVSAGDNLPDFDKGLIGMNIDEEKVIPVTYPEDYGSEELRGQTVPLRVKIIELHEKKVPELTDEWVKSKFTHEHAEGEECDEDHVDTAEKLRSKMKEAMEHAARDIADADVGNKVVAAAVANATVHFPDIMVHESVNERLEELLQELNKRKASLDDYLKYAEKSFDELRTEYEEEARQTLKASLVLRELVTKENIEVSDEDIDAQIAAMAAEKHVPVETVRAYVDKTENMQAIRSRVMHKKVVDFLVHASNIKNVG